jgi:hypothetical protein
MVSRFPVAFRLPAFASWSSIARWGAGPSLRSAYRPCQGRTPTGLSRFARMRCGRGGCPLYPGDCGALAAGRSSPAVTRRFPAASPFTPIQRPTTGASSNEASPRVQSFTRPAFPLPVAPGWNGSPWASPPSFTPRRCRRRMSGWGQALGTCLGYVTIKRPSCLRSHSPRAPSWRTVP